MAQSEIGIIGGSGLYSMPGLSNVKEVRVKTPFGAPSDAYVCGTLVGRKVAFLARHGRGHRILPSELNFRANIHGFKQLGVERIVSISAVGSLKEEHKPLEFVIPDQFFDRTRHRVDTFFGGGVVAHIAFADPVCGELAAIVERACKKAGVVGKHPSLTNVPMGNLQHHTDFRQVYATLIQEWMGADSTKVLGQKFKTLGLIRA